MDKSKTAILRGLTETRAFGHRLAAGLTAGDVILLTGDLGAGKTTLARAIIERLTGVSDAPSPTYTIVQTYETGEGVDLWHADLYRIEAEAELDEIGLEDAFDEAVCLIEWPDRLAGMLPPDHLEVDIRPEPGEEADVRRVRITGRGQWEDRLDEF